MSQGINVQWMNCPSQEEVHNFFKELLLLIKNNPAIFYIEEPALWSSDIHDNNIEALTSKLEMHWKEQRVVVRSLQSHLIAYPIHNRISWEYDNTVNPEHGEYINFSDINNAHIKNMWSVLVFLSMSYFSINREFNVLCDFDRTASCIFYNTFNRQPSVGCTQDSELRYHAWNDGMLTGKEPQMYNYPLPADWSWEGNEEERINKQLYMQFSEHMTVRYVKDYAYALQAEEECVEQESISVSQETSAEYIEEKDSEKTFGYEKESEESVENIYGNKFLSCHLRVDYVNKKIIGWHGLIKKSLFDRKGIIVPGGPFDSLFELALASVPQGMLLDSINVYGKNGMHAVARNYLFSHGQCDVSTILNPPATPSFLKAFDTMLTAIQHDENIVKKEENCEPEQAAYRMCNNF